MVTTETSNSQPPTSSVVVCVYTEDRWDAIVAAVSSVMCQVPLPLEVLVVVDHNARLLSRCARELPGVIVVANEGEPGLAGARNTGVAHSTGDVLCFLDDDARAAPGWLATLRRHYADPAVLGVGGRIEPDWSGGRRPARLPREFDWVVGCSYLGLPARTSTVRNVIGANMSLRRAVFDAVGGFAPGLGRVRSRPAGCEETELCIRALARLHDGRFIYEPAALVHHRVGAERQTWAYFTARCFAEGRSKAVVARLVGTGPGLATERDYVRRVLPRGALAGILDTLRGDPSGLIRTGWIVAGLSLTTAGYCLGGVTASRERDRPQALPPSLADSAAAIASAAVTADRAEAS